MAGKEYKELRNLISALERKLDQFVEFVTQQFTVIKEEIAIKTDRRDVEEIVERVVGRKVDKVLAILDSQSRHFQEQEMLIGQMGRHDRWINKIAGDIGTKLDY